MFKINNVQFKRCLSLGILFFSGTGFNILQMSGGLIVWLLILLLLNFKNLRKMLLPNLLVLITLCSILFVFYSFKSNEMPYFIFVAIVSSYIVLLNYRTPDYRNKFTSDITLLLKFYMYFTLVHIVFLFIGQSLFRPT